MFDETNDKALYDLEWDRVVDHLAGYADTLNGRARCLSLSFYRTATEATNELARVSEYRKMQQMSDPLSLAGVNSSVEGFVIQAEKRGTLDISELVAIADTIAAANAIAYRMHNSGDDFVTLKEMCEEITPLKGALSTIDYAIDRNRSELKDSASQNLGSFRKRVRDLHRKVKRKLDNLLGSKEVKPLLRDNYFTIRDDRYVLPIKTAEKAGLKGIVHGSSSTGQTIFVEPNELVVINNDLTMAEIQVHREELRILGELTKSVANEGSQIIYNLEILTKLDVIQAKASLATVMRGEVPKIIDEAKFNLPMAKHPLLIMKHDEVVPNDLHLGLDFNALILSGANTGGKTVSLKTMGLCVLMAWSGMHLPTAKGAFVGKFNKIFTVIGDEQSLSDDLSTFSANILRLNNVIENCDSKSLILLDEIVVGTDPRQGASLAQAIVESMADSEAKLVITTHYDKLKRLAYGREDFANAAVGLSDDTLKPNYQIHIGIPGSSAAFNIAEELGVLDKVVNRARDLIEGDADELDTMVAKLQEEVARQKSEVRKLEEAKTEFEQSKEEYKIKLAKLQEQGHHEIAKLKEQTLEEITKARMEVKDIIRTLQRGGSMSDANQAMQELNKREKKQKQEIDLATPKEQNEKNDKNKSHRQSLSASDLKEEMEVYISNLGQTGVIVEPVNKRGMALVEVGRLKMRIPVERIKKLFPNESGKSMCKVNSLKASLLESQQSVSGRKEHITCDLRGERVDDALMIADAFLDRAMQRKAPFVYIIHGHGTGRLKQALRQEFSKSPYISKFRPGERGEGQDGVTVVFLNV